VIFLIELSSLNNQQKKAVFHKKGPLLVLSGPGAGKSRDITNRVAYLIDSGISPEKIMITTFTRKAAGELKERVEATLGSSCAKKLRCGTFHSVCLSILKELQPKRELMIIDDQNAANLLTNFAMEEGVSVTSKDLLTDISKMKAWMIDPRAALMQSKTAFEVNLGRIYEKYEKYLAYNNLLDFDNIILELIKLKNEEKHKNVIDNMFDYVLSDEFQDTNFLQGTLLKSFLTKHQNLCVTGDESQAIYNFRGANLDEILNFEKVYKGTKRVTLGLNYRSTKTIVNSSAAVISNNTRKMKKKLVSSSGVLGNPIYIARRYNPENEAELIASLVKCWDENKTTAILVRVNWQMEPIKNALDANGIDYSILRDTSRILDEQQATEKKISLLTIHAAKGLEFDNVIVAGVEEGLLPHYLSFDGFGSIEEERRLFYVALTRAKENVVLTSCYHRKKWNPKSRFIDEIPNKYKEEI